MPTQKDEWVFVIELTTDVMREAETALDQDRPMRTKTPTSENAAHPIRAIALIFDRNADPVLLAIDPTEDLRMLDALARLMRFALLTERSIATLATEFGDVEMKRMFFARRFPRFVYRGIPVSVRTRLPSTLVEAMGRA